MTSWNDFRGAAKRLDDIDLPRLGERIGVGEDEIHAFMDVEAAGSGFDKHGRPKMLFEPHVFYCNLPKAMRSEAERQGLAYAKWKPGAYPKDSYPRLIQAMQIDETAALKSCPWGLGQILGENHKAAGYDTPQEMVQAFMEDEEAHLEAMVSFLVANGLDGDLRAHRWAALARGYNGAGYAANAYDAKLAAAYRKWAKIADTPYEAVAQALEPEIQASPSSPKKDRAMEPETRALAGFEIKAIQKRLRDLGYFQVGKVDGVWGANTTGALSAFQHDNGIPVNGTYDEATRAALAEAQPKPIAPERARTTEADLAAQGSTTIHNAKGITMASVIEFVTGAAACIAFVAQNWQAEQLPFPLSLVSNVLPPWAMPLLMMGFAGYKYLKGRGVIDARVMAERLGLHNGEPDPAPSVLPALSAERERTLAQPAPATFRQAGRHPVPPAARRPAPLNQRWSFP